MLTGTIVQASYTSIFGMIAALLFMRTGNILAPIASHIIVRYSLIRNFYLCAIDDLLLRIYFEHNTAARFLQIPHIHLLLA